MTSIVGQVLVLVMMFTPVQPFPRSFFSKDLESSGSGPEDPARGSVRHHKAIPFLLGRVPGPVGSQGRVGGARSRNPFPTFLSLGRAGPPETSRVQQGLEMWRRSMKREEQDRAHAPVSISLRDLNLKEQSCTAIPFTQRVSEPGCEPLSLQNKLCFGHCSSLFVPPVDPGSSVGPVGGLAAPCSRCAPVRARAVLVALRCGRETREKRVMVVEECKCETGREETKAENRNTLL